MSAQVRVEPRPPPAVRAQRDDPVEVKSAQKTSGLVVDPTLSSIDALDVDSIAVGLCADVRPLAGVVGMLDWRLCGRLSRMLEAGIVTGNDGEKILFPTAGRVTVPRLFLFGWGLRAQAKERASERIATMVATLADAKVKRTAFAFPEPASELMHLVPEVEKQLGGRLVAVFGPDPISPV